MNEIELEKKVLCDLWKNLKKKFYVIYAASLSKINEETVDLKFMHTC